MRALLAAFIAITLSACGHTALSYTPSAPAGMTPKQAASTVEQGFYEDFGSTKPQSAIVTDEYIGLSDGTVSRGIGLGQASAYNGVVVGLSSMFMRTEEISQRIYFRSLGIPIVLEKNGRDNRYAVTIRTAQGTTARNVHFRSERDAKSFADALVYLRDSSASGALTAPQAQANSAQPTGQPLTEAAYKQEQLKKLMDENLPYDEYQKRYKAIMGE